jgi:HPt (histidine-containing phosphotransfer) domain-containing protein
MFILPIPRSPGERGEEDHTGGMIARTRRSFPLNVHMGVNGFIVCALLIQAFSIAGIMPAEVWIVQPGYALTVCIGLLALSACILFSLKSLLTQFPQEQTLENKPVPMEAQSPLPPENPEAVSAEPDAPLALVLQSSRTVQSIIEKSLAKAGIGSVCVSDEAAAQRALQADRIDLLIADAALCGSDRSVALRDSCRRKGIRVLALTAEKGRDPRQSFADASVAMPIIPDELARRAMELMRPAALQPQATIPESGVAPDRELPKLEPEPLDARALADLEKLGGRDFVRDIVVQFVADSAAVLASLTAAVTSRDPRVFREQAHALRSCAANVGAQNVYRMCLAWRDLDAQEIAASGAEYMQMLEEEFGRVRGALAPMLQQRDGSGPESEAA